MAGFFITLEGIEGAGKTTLAQRLESWLSEQGLSHRMAREPGGTPGGEAIRQVLLGAPVPLCPESELFLVEAARAQLMREIVLPGLERDQVVIVDRHTDSTLAYQGYGRGLSLPMIRSLNRFACRDRFPDCTVLLDIDARAGLDRSLKTKARGDSHDRFEMEAVEFMERVRLGFLELAREEPARFLVVSALEDTERVWQKVRDALAQRLGRLNRTAILSDQIE